MDITNGRSKSKEIRKGLYSFQYMCDLYSQSSTPLLPSIVVCPPTLTGHWVYEVKQFCPSSQLRPLQYAGSPMERAR